MEGEPQRQAEPQRKEKGHDRQVVLGKEPDHLGEQPEQGGPGRHRHHQERAAARARPTAGQLDAVADEQDRPGRTLQDVGVGVRRTMVGHAPEKDQHDAEQAQHQPQERAARAQGNPGPASAPGQPAEQGEQAADEDPDTGEQPQPVGGRRRQIGAGGPVEHPLGFHQRSITGCTGRPTRSPFGPDPHLADLIAKLHRHEPLVPERDGPVGHLAEGEIQRQVQPGGVRGERQGVAAKGAGRGPLGGGAQPPADDPVDGVAHPGRAIVVKVVVEVVAVLGEGVVLQTIEDERRCAGVRSSSCTSTVRFSSM